MRTPARRLLLFACVATGFASLAQELPVIVPVGKSTYNAVAQYLNPGGSLYAYIGTAEWAGKLDQLASQIEGMALSNRRPEQLAQAQAAFKIVHRFISECGLADLGGLGVSSVQTGESLFHNRVVFQHGPGAAKGLYWEALGGENGEFDLLQALPANTAVASWIPCDLKPIWAWVQKAVAESGSQPLAEGFEQSLQRLQAQGIAVDPWVASLGRHAAIVLTTDPARTYPFPAGGSGKTIEVPGFALALLLEVRDDTIFKAIDAMLGTNPQVGRTDTPGLRQRVMPFPLPPPIRATVAQLDDMLILSSSDELVGQLASGAGGLAETALFKQLAANLPSQGTGFTFASPALGEALTQVMQASLAAAGGEAASAGLNSMLFASLAGQAVYGVSVRTPDAIVGLSNTNFDYGQNLITQAAMAPVAILAGMLLPALSQARQSARNASDINNLKQIGLGVNNLKQIGLGVHMSIADNDGNFPADLGVLMEKGYVTAGQVFVGPGAGTPPPADAEQLRAGQCDYVYFGKGRTIADCGSMDPIACSKPGLLGGQAINVLYGDGHVQAHPFPPEDVKQLLGEAGSAAAPGPVGVPAAPRAPAP